MTVCKLETRSGSYIQAEISDIIFLSKNHPNMTEEESNRLDMKMRKKWVSVESVQSCFKKRPHLDDYKEAFEHETLDNINREYQKACAAWFEDIEKQLGLLEQKEPFCEKASPKKQEEKKP